MFGDDHCPFGCTNAAGQLLFRALAILGQQGEQVRFGMLAEPQVEELLRLFDVVGNQHKELFLHSPMLGEFLLKPLECRQRLVPFPLDDLGDALLDCPADQRCRGQSLAVKPGIDDSQVLVGESMATGCAG